MNTSVARSLFSHHVFLFPFKWVHLNQQDATGGMQEHPTELAQIRQLFDDEGPWKCDAFRIDKPYAYNEYNYFYDYVSEILYDLHDEKGRSPLYSTESETVNVIQHYEYELTDGDYYKISVEGNEGLKEYELEVESILLHFYHTEVGVLSFHLNNRKYKQEEDILRINQFGRRLYPPFFQLDPAVIADPKQLFTFSYWQVGRGELAAKIELGVARQLTQAGAPGLYVEDFSAYRKYSHFEAGPFRFPAFIRALLPSAFTDINKTSENAKYYISPVLDDRMFTVCWYGNKTIANRLYQKKKDDSSVPGEPRVHLNFLTDEWWYRYLFVDAGIMTCQNEAMQAELVGCATNARWAGYGTYYGVTDYSFVMLTPDFESLGSAAFLVNHLRGIYYKLVELVLVQRASVQRFSDQVTHISKLSTSDTNVTDRVSNLYKQYIRFVNKIYFREVTAQTQGMELYRKLQEQSNVEKLVKDLDGEINELHNYVLLVEERNRNVKLELLTKLGSATLFPGLILAFNGISFWPEVGDSYFLLFISALVICSGLSGYAAYLFFTRRKPWMRHVGLGMLLLMLLIGAAAPMLLVQFSKPVPSGTDQVSAKQIQQLQKQVQNLNQTVDSLYLESKKLTKQPDDGR